MLCCPFEYQRSGTPGQSTTADFVRAHIDFGFVLGGDGMEMRRRMFSPEHLDHDTEKCADRWQGKIMRDAFLKSNSMPFRQH